MPLKVAIQMDPVEGINPYTDSTYLLGLEALRRGHELFYYTPANLSLENGRVFARGRALQLFEDRAHYYFEPDDDEVLMLEAFDIILMRQDPPFDMAYITATHILEHISDKVLVLNNPAAVRNAPEKLLVTHFPDLTPPTLITRDRAAIQAFRATHKDIVIKPLFGAGGSQVFHVTEDSDNLNALFEMFTEMYREPIIAQKYLRDIRRGDKRIILLDGQPIGALLRVPPQGDVRANLHSGGHGEKTTLTPREQEICERIGPTLAARGLVFVGIDVIDGYLTEINVTSPTCLQEINEADSVQLEQRIWDKFEEKLK